MFYHLKNSIIIPTLLLLLFVGCKSKKNMIAENVHEEKLITAGLSSFVLDVNIDAYTLETIIQNELPTPLYQEITPEQTIVAERNGNIQLNFLANALEYTIPLNIAFKKKTLFGEVGGDGSITLTLRSNYTIDSDWSLNTTTSLTNYQWVKEPKLSIGGINISLSLLKSTIVSQVKKHLPPTIDQQITEQADLRKIIESLWVEQQKGQLISEDYDFWLKMTPENLKISSFNLLTNRKLNLKIEEKLYAQSFLGKPSHRPQIDNLIPEFKPGNQIGDEMHLKLLTHMPYPQLSKITTQQLKGEEFTASKYTVSVSNVKIYDLKKQIGVDVQLEGDINGLLKLKGVPFIDEVKNVPQIKDMVVDIKTKNVLYRAGAWIFKDEISKRFQRELNISLEDNFNAIKAQIKDELQNIEAGDYLNVSGNLKEIKVTDTYWSPQELTLMIEIKGILGARIKMPKNN